MRIAALRSYRWGETGDILADLLTIIEGRDLPALDKADHLETLLAVADKYEMPMVKSVVRMAFSSPLLDASPIRVYGIACRMSWKQEAMAASSRTLGIDLSDPALHSEMAAWEPRHRSMLLDLHRRRKKEFLASLDDPLMFSANIVGARCNSTGCTAMLNHTRWWAFKYALATRLIESPVGPGLVDEICCMQELWDVAEAKCTDCHKGLYLMPLTMEHLQSVFRDLPRTVEWEDSEEQAT
ncbi:hypothetical protein BN946_scf184977.g11 [Trametes cinnabarina]|uniref:BTB domain-containing protein n=1 Tax=Pycnoporus cinnabarinus TaxID=5643 RepID=A0A060SJE8_PYCCI|nr:hypothetical protein BN946_scf184977.g11 [Trametes cinnabarina]